MIVAALALFVSAPAAAQDHANTLQLSASLSAERGSSEFEQRIATSTSTNDFDYRAKRIGGFTFGYMRGLSDLVRLGGGVNYRGELVIRNREEGEDPERYAMGRRVETWAGIEFAIDITESIQLLPLMRVGALMLFPNGDLSDDIDNAQTRGADVRGGMRPGIYVAPGIAARYHLTGPLYARLDLLAEWQRTWVYSYDDRVSGLPVSLKGSLRSLRYTAAFGLEVGF